MIDIRFLNIPPEIRLRSGMEFLDWQDKNFYLELSEFFETCIKADYTIAMEKADREKLASIVKKHSNITVLPVIEAWGNAAIDAGYINPRSVLNINNLDMWLSPSETKTAELMKRMKTSILKGWCDLKTGKVEGDFKNIEFNLYIAKSLGKQCMENAKRFPKDITLSNVLASIILHEIGHAFFGLHYVSASVVDNAIGMSVLKTLAGERDKNRKAVIVKNVKEIAEIDLSQAMETDDLTPEAVLVIFSEGVARRDSTRALSLGVREMTFEVLSDAYSIRMGGSKGLVGFLAGRNNYKPAFITLSIGILAALFPPLIGVGTVIMLFGVQMLFNTLHLSLVPTIYDTPYRRVKNILRENIAFLNSKPAGYSVAQLAQAKADAIELEKIVESSKSFFESTWIQRWTGFTTQGKQFRKNDFEHYTADLASSRLALHTTLSRS